MSQPCCDIGVVSRPSSYNVAIMSLRLKSKTRIYIYIYKYLFIYLLNDFIFMDECIYIILFTLIYLLHKIKF